MPAHAVRPPSPVETVPAACVDPRADEAIILVDERNHAIGSGGKMEVHRRGLLHRAFSIFLFDGQGRVLLQRRASGKYHSGGLWANTCCGHPRHGERSPDAARRRLGEELGAGLARSSPLRFGFHARYRVLLDKGLCENELVYVYSGRMGDGLDPEPSEVSETRLMPLDALLQDARDNPCAYVYWLRHYLALHGAALTTLKDEVLGDDRG